MTDDEINTLREKAELYDMWECVHNLEAVYDFDSVMDADELKETLSEIINLELFKLNERD